MTLTVFARRLTCTHTPISRHAPHSNRQAQSASRRRRRHVQSSVVRCTASTPRYRLRRVGRHLDCRRQCLLIRERLEHDRGCPRHALWRGLLRRVAGQRLPPRLSHALQHVPRLEILEQPQHDPALRALPHRVYVQPVPPDAGALKQAVAHRLARPHDAIALQASDAARSHATARYKARWRRAALARHLKHLRSASA